MKLRTLTLLLPLGCSADDTAGSSSTTGASSTTTDATVSGSSTSAASTGSGSGTSTTAAATSDSSSTGATGSTGEPSEACAGLATLELQDPYVLPAQDPDWNSGESAFVGVTISNPTAQDYSHYPGIVVAADHPDVTSGSSSNYLYAALANTGTELDVTFDAAASIPAGTNVTFTITLVTIDGECPNMKTVEVVGVLQ